MFDFNILFFYILYLYMNNTYSPIVQAKRSNVLHIRSKEAIELTTGYNTHLRVYLKNSIEVNENEEVHVSIMSMEFPYSFYNISTELENNKLVYDTNNTLTFPSQNYSICQLVNYFNDDANFSALFRTQYDGMTNKITFTNKDNSNPHTINFILSNINKVIGWDEEQDDITISAGGNTVSPNVCNLATVHSILVRSNLSSANTQSTRNGNSTILQKISVDKNSGFIIYMNQQDFRQISIIQSKNIDFIDLLITNQDDKLLQNNNVNYELSILFEVFNRDRFNNRRILEPVRRQMIDTQPQSIEVPRPRLDFTGDNVDVEENIDLTHPIEDTNEAQHKTKRIVLNELLDRIKKQD